MVKSTKVMNEHLQQRYRALGLKLTPQRLAILSYLEGNTRHPSADEVYRAVLGVFPTMSFATVYNILEALREKGFIAELSVDPVKKRFDADPAPHHHLVCLSCGKIEDVHQEIALPALRKHAGGFTVLRSQIAFYGHCPSCRAA